jgi:hypothetical protein
VESLGNPALGRISYSGAQTSQRLKVPANNFPLPATYDRLYRHHTRRTPAPIRLDPGKQLILFGFWPDSRVFR